MAEREPGKALSLYRDNMRLTEPEHWVLIPLCYITKTLTNRATFLPFASLLERF